MLAKKALAASVSAGPKVYVEDVFSTYLYTGTGASQTITNNIDLSGEGGLVWIKNRITTAAHYLFDTSRGANNYLSSNATTGSQTLSSTLTSFGSSGFSLGSNNSVNKSPEPYVSWTFRQAEKFFDVVTYTGNGTKGRTVAHNLGSVPGCIIIKNLSTSITTSWPVYHRSLGASQVVFLNDSDAAVSTINAFNNTAPTSTVFTVDGFGGWQNTNASGDTYIAYVFAHNAGGFGDASDQSVISCGNYTGNGSSIGPSITLGWEPQWLLIRRTDSSSSEGWWLVDNMRVIPVGSAAPVLHPNNNTAEVQRAVININATGFSLGTTNTDVNANGANYIYVAIRRGPMKTPTDATKVFVPTVYTGTNVDNRLINTTIDPDFVMIRQRNDTAIYGMYTGSRLTGNEYMVTGELTGAATDPNSFDSQNVSGFGEIGLAFNSMSGVWVGNDTTRKFNANTTSNNHIIHAFKRAPKFFDVVCYTGTGSSRTVSHNLGAVPELMVVKQRSTSRDWAVYSSALGNTKYLLLNSDSAEQTGGLWNNTTPTSSVFTVGAANETNASNGTFIALLFSSLDGVSKTGTYTGNGSSQTINCGFTAGARYVFIKRTSNSGMWRIFDTARGIVLGNDPFLSFNTNSAENTGNDTVDPDNTGFIVEGADTNASGSTYIYLAIA